MKAMKNILVLLILLTFPVATSSAATYVDASAINVDLISQTPNPARPGETVEITLSVQNIGNENLANLLIEIEPEYPFSQVSSESLSKTISYLNARQDEDEAAVVKFKMNVDPDVSEGFYDLDIKVTDNTTGATITTTLEVEIKGKEYAQIVTINTASIDRAVEEPLEFIVTNTGNSPLKNMVISWDEPNGVILPVYSDNTKYISYLEAGESATVVYSIMADANANAGLYQLDICLEFEDYDSNVNEINTKAGLFVGGGTDFDVAFSEGDAGKVSLSVANVGNNEAYSVKVIIPEQEKYKVIGSSASIVGNLDKGDYTIASFTIVNNDLPSNSENEDKSMMNRDEMDPEEMAALRGSRPSQDELQVVIEYTDSTGQRLSVEKSVPIELMGATGDVSAGGYSSKRNNTSSTSSYLTYLVVLAVVVGGAMYYRKMKASKGKDDEVQDIS